MKNIPDKYISHLPSSFDKNKIAAKQQEDMLELSPKILICDDEPLITSSIKALLTLRGHKNIITTNSPSQALQLIKDGAPDLVILDVMMPGMTGFDLLEAAEEFMSKADFIMVTGETSIDFAIEALRKGACDYLKKPFEPEELCIRVEKVLAQRQAQQKFQTVTAENKILEGQLRQSQKMEAIGTLAGGIAHDFNNVLSIIMGNVELAKVFLPIEHQAYPHVQQVLSASERAKELIKQLLSFSRKEESSYKTLSLNKVIPESLALMRASLPTNIVIESNIQEVECTVVGDSTQMNQIIFNLCTNAAHAMENKGGKISISLGLLNKTKSFAKLGLSRGDYVHLEVCDDGHGIPDNILNRIFDPYFTTKSVNEGTGMGLAVILGIVRNSGGDIRVQSTLGEGTTFHLYFPLVKPTVPVETPKMDRRQLPRGREHIMLVDDEKMIIELTEKVLQRLGYTVSSYSNSMEAVKAFQLSPNSYDLLITDMTMPGVDGLELIETVRAIRANLPIILSTGYNGQVNQAKMKELEVNAFIMKPIGIQQLALMVRDVLPPDSDRRQHSRYRVPKNTSIVSSQHSKEMVLLDISLSGLAFSLDNNIAQKDDAYCVSIMNGDGDCLVADIPCQQVSDFTASENINKRVRVAFEELSNFQIDQLKRFLESNANKIIH